MFTWKRIVWKTGCGIRCFQTVFEVWRLFKHKQWNDVSGTQKKLCSLSRCVKEGRVWREPTPSDAGITGRDIWCSFLKNSRNETQWTTAHFGHTTPAWDDGYLRSPHSSTPTAHLKSDSAAEVPAFAKLRHPEQVSVHVSSQAAAEASDSATGFLCVHAFMSHHWPSCSLHMCLTHFRYSPSRKLRVSKTHQRHFSLQMFQIKHQRNSIRLKQLQKFSNISRLVPIHFTQANLWVMSRLWRPTWQVSYIHLLNKDFHELKLDRFHPSLSVPLCWLKELHAQ